MFITPTDFKQAFEAAFIVNRRQLHWDTGPRRTANMLAHIYRTIANSFPGLDIEYEHNKIDAVLYRDNLDCIDVAIEHENDIKTIATELGNFAKNNFPLNVLITYTGCRNEYIINRQSENMNALSDRLLLILNPEHLNPWNGEQNDPNQHNLVLWEYFLWTKNGLEKL
jgi:hypothetical protein